MTDLMTVLGLAMLPALGNFSGAMAAEAMHASPRNLNRALHAAAAIVIAIVSVELMPRALEATSAWVIALAFALGGLAYVGIEAAVARLERK